MQIKLGLLFGGSSGAHEVSLKAARDIAKELQVSEYRELYNIIPFYILKNGKFSSQEIAEFTLRCPQINSEDNRSNHQENPWGMPVELTNIDVCISTILCGPGSGDGTIQGFLETLKIPCVGSSVLGATIGGDKITMKRVFSQADLPQVSYESISDYELLSDPEKLNEFIDTVESSFDYPYFVKPSRLGSSMGISKVYDRESFKKGLSLASNYDNRIIVEQGVRARELSCSVLGNRILSASTIAEKIHDSHFNDYQAKYQNRKGKFKTVIDLQSDEIMRIKQLTMTAFKLAGCWDTFRADFFITEDDQQVIINEINPVFNFSKDSMYAFLWKSSGFSFPDLIHSLVTLALDRYNSKSLILE